MREILFRAKSIEDKTKIQWIYGFYREFLTDKGIIYFIDSKGMNENFFIDKNTIGQYTGLTDKNGVKIFEGDIVEFDRRQQAQPLKRKKGTVFYEKETCAFSVEKEYISQASMLCDLKNLEVIGNMHDNPELEKRKQ